jgi:hypothetical protein
MGYKMVNKLTIRVNTLYLPLVRSMIFSCKHIATISSTLMCHATYRSVKNYALQKIIYVDNYCSGRETTRLLGIK